MTVSIRRHALCRVWNALSKVTEVPTTISKINLIELMTRCTRIMFNS